MLKLGSYYIHKYEATRADEREVAVVDRSAVLYDLLTSEALRNGCSERFPMGFDGFSGNFEAMSMLQVWFQNEKQSLVEVYLNIFEDTMDPMEQRLLAQRIMDVMALRPRLDLQDSPEKPFLLIFCTFSPQNQWISMDFNQFLSMFL